MELYQLEMISLQAWVDFIMVPLSNVLLLTLMGLPLFLNVKYQEYNLLTDILAAQMPQSAYTPLDLPYMFIGLGRTNNYIENFVMGISTTDGPDVETWGLLC